MSDNYKSNFCGKCGTPIQAGDNFCRVCGVPYNQSTAEPPVQPAQQSAQQPENAPPAQNIAYVKIARAYKKPNLLPVVVIIGVCMLIDLIFRAINFQDTIYAFKNFSLSNIYTIIYPFFAFSVQALLIIYIFTDYRKNNPRTLLLGIAFGLLSATEFFLSVVFTNNVFGYGFGWIYGLSPVLHLFSFIILTIVSVFLLISKPKKAMMIISTALYIFNNFAVFILLLNYFTFFMGMDLDMLGGFAYIVGHLVSQLLGICLLIFSIMYRPIPKEPVADINN